MNESKEGFEVQVAAPGMSKKDFNISVENACLTIAAEKEESTEQKKKHYTRREFNYNAFERNFDLPVILDKDSVKAEYKDGILKINIEKTEEAKKEHTKKIDVA